MYDLPSLLHELDVQFRIVGPPPASFRRISTLEDADSTSLVFASTPPLSIRSFLERTSASTILVGPPSAWKGLDSQLSASSRSFAVVSSPRLVVTKLLRKLYPFDDPPPAAAIHPTAIVNPQAVLGRGVTIGPFSQVGACEIGANSHIGAYCTIKNPVSIGSNVTIREHCVIGGCGFGFVRDEEGIPLRMPHVGNLVIEDDVQVFPYANIDRGTLGETRVSQGACIDHYCHVAHNTYVGRYAILTAGTILCGGAVVGDYAYLGVGSSVREKVRVGARALVGMGAVVTREAPPNTVVAGIPAKPLSNR